MNTDTLRYAGFWPRLAARFLDLAILLPLSALVIWGSTTFRLFSLYYLLPGTLLGLFYNVYLVRRYGGTPGKLIAGIRIRKVNGEAIRYREAFLRFCVDFALVMLLSAAFLIPQLEMSDAEFHSFTFLERNVWIVQHSPGWATPVRWLHTAWVWGEFLVLLTNRQRRALHDFIAGTVVVFAQPAAEPPSSRPQTPATPIDY